MTATGNRQFVFCFEIRMGEHRKSFPVSKNLIKTFKAVLLNLVKHTYRGTFFSFLILYSLAS